MKGDSDGGRSDMTRFRIVFVRQLCPVTGQLLPVNLGKESRVSL